MTSWPDTAIEPAETTRIRGIAAADPLPDAEPLPDDLAALPEASTSIDPNGSWRPVEGTSVSVRDTTKVVVPGDQPGDAAVVEQVPVDERGGSAPEVEVAIEPSDQEASPSLLVTIEPEAEPSDASPPAGPAPSSTPSTTASPSATPTASDAATPMGSAPPSPTATPTATESQAPEESAEGTTALEVRLSYADFRHAYAGDWGARLRVIAYPSCFRTTPDQDGCGEGIEVPSINDANKQTVTFTTADLATPLVTPDVVGSAADGGVDSWDFGDAVAGGRAFGRSAAVVPAAGSSGSSGGTVYALSAASGGTTGNYAAVPLQPSGSWQVGEGSGEFSYSYPFELPKPAIAGPTPDLALSYSSGSVDGMTKAQNGQASMAGIGWDLSTGYIVRNYKPCKEDGWPTKGDLCWLWDSTNSTTLNDLSIVLNGRSSRLIRVGLGNSYRLQDDPGWLVTRVWRTQTATMPTTEPDNTDNDNEAFKVQGPDGTTYWFGWGWGRNSTWTVPVYGNHPGEPCSSAAANADKWCSQAWRWNLDRVVDSHGNEINYEYARETNYYSRFGSVNNLQAYDRGGYLSYIRYGEGSADNYSEVFVETRQRCVAVINDPEAPCLGNPRQSPAQWPDVPADQICYDTDTACQNGSPTFFSLRRYEAVNTRRFYTDSGGVRRWALADRYQLNFNLPVPPGGDSDSLRDLWLVSIQRTGLQSPSVTLPSTVFTGDFRRNRVVAEAGQYSFQKMRVTQVRTEPGGTVDVAYAHEVDRACDEAYVASLARSQSDKECFPAQYNDDWEWWHKYTVQRISLGDPRLGITANAPHGDTAQNNLGRLRVFDYDYEKSPAWRYRNNLSVKTANETWDDWRGYNTVSIRMRKVGPDQEVDAGASHSRRRVVVYQGMDLTKKNNASPTQLHENVKIADSDGVDHLDSYWLAGKVIEEATEQISPASGEWEKVSQTKNEWGQFETVGFDFGRPGRHVYLKSTTVLPRVDSPKRTTDYTVNDGGSNHRGVLLGAQTSAIDDMATSATTDDIATCTSWISNATTAMRLPRQVATWKQGCGVGALVSKGESYYDGHTSLTADPTEGELRQSVSYSDAGSTIRVQHAYDANGRLYRSSLPYAFAGSAFDSSALTSHVYSETNYNPGVSAGKTLRTIRVTTAKNAPGVGEMATTTTLDYARSLPISVQDPNAETTAIAYDGAGRVLTVDKPGVPSGEHSFAYEYSLPALTAGPSRITTRVLRDSGVTDVSYGYYDGWGRQIQNQVLRQAPTGSDPDGRIVSYTGYDDRGLPWLTAPAVPVDGVSPSPVVPVTLDAMRHHQRTTFDALGRPTDVVDYSNAAPNFTTSTSYASGFDKVSVTAAGSANPLQTTVTALDALGRAGSVSQYANGQSSDVTKDDGYAEYAYDDAGQLETIRTPIHRAANGVPDEWATYTYDYDLLGRRVSADDPDTGETTYTYDALGNVVTQKQTALVAEHGFITNTYDAIGRPTKREQTEGSSNTTLATWAYGNDPVLNTVNALVQETSRTKIVDGSTTHDWTFTTATPSFDARGNPSSAKITYPAVLTGETADPGTSTVSKTTTYTYDQSDAIKTVGLPGVAAGSGGVALPATTLTYTYGRNGLFDKLADSSRTIGDAQYDTLNRPVGLWSGTGATDADRLNRTYAWYTQDRLSSQSVKVGPQASESTELIYDYEYDAVGNPIRIKGTRPQGGGSLTAAWCYTYDGISRLTRAQTGVPDASTKSCNAAGDAAVAPITGANYDLSYTFDQARLKTVRSGTSGPQVTYAYGDSDHPHAATGLTANGTATGVPTSGTLGYDAAGRAERWTAEGAADVNYTYDVQGNLVSMVDTASGPSANEDSIYAYDANGMRLVRKTGNETVLYLGDLEITSTTESGSTTRSSRRVYTTPGGTPLAVEETGASSVGWTYVSGDSQDSIRFSRDNQTNAATHLFYLPYGDPIGGPAPAAERGFLNKTHDPDGTVRLDHRQYDPGLNVLTTPDPLLAPGEPTTLNPYSYAGFNPISFSDASGLCWNAQSCEGDLQQGIHNPPPKSTHHPTGEGSGGQGGDEDPYDPYDPKPQSACSDGCGSATASEAALVKMNHYENYYGYMRTREDMRLEAEQINRGAGCRSGGAIKCGAIVVVFFGGFAVGVSAVGAMVAGEVTAAGLATSVRILVDSIRNTAYRQAAAGGRHSGFFNQYAKTSTREIERGIASINKQIAKHQAKIKDPASKIDDWATLDPRRRESLLNHHWPADIARQREQLNILRGILLRRR